MLPFLYPSRHVCGRVRWFSEYVGVEMQTRLNPAADDYCRPNFADKAKLMLYPGSGGDGCISFLREAYVDDGPANGGDGGHGGNIYIQAAYGETSLHKLARRRFVRAGKGKTGQGSARGGQRGEDVIITVPVGTVIRELSREDVEAESEMLRRGERKRWRRKRKEQPPPKPESTGARDDDADEDLPHDPNRHKWILYPGVSSSEASRIELPRLPFRDRLFVQPKAPIDLDLSRPTPRPVLLATGGLGGLGNPHFVSRFRPKPLFATRGEQAMTMEIELELKLLADVGLVGLPNAGKSTLLRALSNSRARVGHWAFTTLQPNIGTVVLDNNRGRPVVTSFRRRDPNDPDFDPFASDDDDDAQRGERRTRFTVADIPGLIEGAHLDRGLGIAFLRHVERAGVLAMVIDLSAGPAIDALRALWLEVGLYAQMREEEELDRERQARLDEAAHAAHAAPSKDGFADAFSHAFDADAPPKVRGLHIACKPWFVVATKADLPDTQANFAQLRDYLTAISAATVPHPSGVEGAWTQDCRVVPVSAINGQGVDRIIHWTVGLLDG